MPPEAHAFSRVVLDTSVFRRFDDAGRLILLGPYFQQRKPGDRPDKNAGEISAVLYAKCCGAALVIAEDHLAKRMCLPTDLDVPRLSTAHLVLEMVCQNYLSYDDAWPIWDAATPQGVGLEVFHKRLHAAGLSSLVPN